MRSPPALCPASTLSLRKPPSGHLSNEMLTATAAVLKRRAPRALEQVPATPACRCCPVSVSPPPSLHLPLAHTHAASGPPAAHAGMVRIRSAHTTLRGSGGVPGASVPLGALYLSAAICCTLLLSWRLLRQAPGRVHGLLAGTGPYHAVAAGACLRLPAVDIVSDCSLVTPAALSTACPPATARCQETTPQSAPLKAAAPASCSKASSSSRRGWPWLRRRRRRRLCRTQTLTPCLMWWCASLTADMQICFSTGLPASSRRGRRFSSQVHQGEALGFGQRRCARWQGWLAVMLCCVAVPAASLCVAGTYCCGLRRLPYPHLITHLRKHPWPADGLRLCTPAGGLWPPTPLGSLDPCPCAVCFRWFAAMDDRVMQLAAEERVPALRADLPEAGSLHRDIPSFRAIGTAKVGSDGA